MLGEKRYLVGRRDDGDEGSLLLGRYLALDGSTGADVFLDVLRPHAVLICGKRGYGKSYTMGVLIEELARLPYPIRKNFCAIVVDTMGIFTCMGKPSSERGLGEWGLRPEACPIRTFAPRAHVRSRPVLPLEIPTGSLSYYDYCELLGIEQLSEHGAVLMKAIGDKKDFEIEDLIKKADGSSVLGGLLHMLSSWGLFSGKASFDGLLEPGSVNVLDLSGYGHEPEVKSCIVASLARALYDVRVAARKAEDGAREKPLVWLFIDEAHMFMDASQNSRAGRVLANEWLRQGRQPGLSLVLATQRPSALGKDVLSQADVIICHRLTLRDDVEALEAARPTYVKEPLPDAMARLGKGRGAAIVIDDATESYHVIKIRPRVSEHGGSEPVIYVV
jgi:DNA helicase HerA-like ATPase